MNLQELSPAIGSKQQAWRIGRGIGSGNGKTSARGHKGQKARSGYSRKRGFEGGQMPLHRRLPKRGFSNVRFADTPPVIINLSAYKDFKKGEVVTPEVLQEKGIINDLTYNGKPLKLKVLAGGEINTALTICANVFSKSAKEKIEAAGGKAEVV